MNPSEMTPEQRDPEGRDLAFEIGSTLYRHLCGEALAKQTVPYAIAPGQSVAVNRGGDRGVILTAYQEILLSDMKDPTLHAKDAMKRLVNKGLVLAKETK